MPEQPRGTRKPARQAVADNAPWKPAAWELPDGHALQALARGNATPEQQKRALDWVIRSAAGLYEHHFYPGEDGRRDTDFALGRAYVGQQMAKLLSVNLSLLKKGETT